MKKIILIGCFIFLAGCFDIDINDFKDITTHYVIASPKEIPGTYEYYDHFLNEPFFIFKLKANKNYEQIVILNGRVVLARYGTWKFKKEKSSFFIDLNVVHSKKRNKLAGGLIIAFMILLRSKREKEMGEFLSIV